jgi:GDP-L-fucose synthase
MPTNMYGPRDNFDLETSHVLPAFINRFVSAKKSSSKEVVLWGTGAPKREFLHSRDLASAVLFAVEKYDSDLHLNVGVGADISIKDLAEMVSAIAGFEGAIAWDHSKPDGTPRKILDVSRIKSMGWNPAISLESGIRDTVHWFEANYN